VTERKQQQKRELVPDSVLHDMAEVAKSAGPRWTTRRIRRLLLSKNGAHRIGGRWYTTKSAIREAFGKLASDIIAGLHE
jgi:hypothetical protein